MPKRARRKFRVVAVLLQGDMPRSREPIPPPRGFEDANVIALYDDNALKKLLDEAIAYKTPKDREGKSDVFLQLLQKAEADDKEPFVKIGSGPRGHRNRGAASVSERGAAGGSLQNISSATEADTHYTGTKRKQRRPGPGSSVSSRQTEGGSLPCNVNKWVVEPWVVHDSDLSEGARLPEAIGSASGSGSTGLSVQGTAGATLARRQTLKHSASNELPTTDRALREVYPLRRHHSSTEQSEGRKMNDEGRGYKSDYLRLSPGQKDEISSTSGSDYALPDGPESDYGSTGLTSSGAYRATASFQLGVETGDQIQFGADVTSRLSNGVSSIDLNWEDRSVQCLVGGSSLIGERGQRRVADSSSLRHTEVSYPKLYGISSAQKAIDKRSDDVGGGAGRVASSCKKNSKRKQNSDKNVAVTRSEDMPGHRSDLAEKDVNTILSFIESDGKPSKGLKKQLPKQKPKDNRKQAKQITKASSLEELSQRNIEDLTEGSDDRKPRAEEQRRSWGDKMFVSSGIRDELAHGHPPFIQTEVEDDASDSEFQMVTKKTRRRRGVEAAVKRVRNRRTGWRSPRRKSTSSVPPSERSGDSDLDSIHSLPAVGGRASDSDCDNPSAAAQGAPISTPAADVLPSPAVPVQDASVLTHEDFPSLPVKPEPKLEPKPEVAKPKTRSKSVGPNTRPPVILLDERRQQSPAVCELTFGFEVNQQLLQSSGHLERKIDGAVGLKTEPTAKREVSGQPKPGWRPVEMPPYRYTDGVSERRSSAAHKVADTLSFTTPNLTCVPPPASATVLRKSHDPCTIKTYMAAAARPPHSKPLAWKTPILATSSTGGGRNTCEPTVVPACAESLPSHAEAVALTIRKTQEQIAQNSHEVCGHLSGEIRSVAAVPGVTEAYATCCPKECHLVVLVMPPAQDTVAGPVRVSETGTMTEELMDTPPPPAVPVKVQQDLPKQEPEGSDEEYTDKECEEEAVAHPPPMSENDRALVEYLRRSFNEALADPETVIYKE